jgi:hypothetical protein
MAVGSPPADIVLRMGGPILIFDKSALQSLTIDEAGWLDNFFQSNLTPLFFEVRTYAELVQAAQRDHERQQRASQVPATQPLAVSDAPDSIPTTEIRVNDAFTAPDPDPAALAPLDSANLDPTNPDSANPDSTNDDAQQLLDSLVADVVTAGSSVPSLSLDDDELAAPPHAKTAPQSQIQVTSQIEPTPIFRGPSARSSVRRRRFPRTLLHRTPRPQMLHLPPSLPPGDRRVLSSLAQSPDDHELLWHQN